MNTSPVKFRITEESTPGNMSVIRLEAKTGIKVCARIEMSLEDFSKALMGREILGAYSQGAGE